MASKIFLNLPVKNLQKSIEFFTQIGYTFNPQFTDDQATCMIISENIFVMLLEEARFQTFTPKQIPNAHETSQILIALDTESREEVDTILEKALAAGGTEARPAQDYRPDPGRQHEPHVHRCRRPGRLGHGLWHHGGARCLRHPRPGIQRRGRTGGPGPRGVHGVAGLRLRAGGLHPGVA